MTTLSRIAFMKPAEVSEVEPQPIRAASYPERFDPAPPRATPTGPTQPFADGRQNSRLDAALRDPLSVTWAQRFASPLRPDTRAHSVLQHRDAILVQAPVWQLFGLNGSPRRAGRAGPSPMVISPDERAFLWVNSDGYLVSAPLDTGRTRWSYGLHLADGATFPFVGVRGPRVVVVGVEFAGNPEAQPKQATRLAVEVIEPGSPVDASPEGILRSAKTPGALEVGCAGDAFAAMSDDRVVVAWRDHLLAVGFDLSTKQLLRGTFEPRAISLGEAGRAYLIVRTSEGPRLWMLNAQGEQVFSVRLPDDAADTRVPPIITADHRVFVVTDSRITAFGPMGDQLWEFAPPKGRPRASVTAEGWLLVAVDDIVGIMDAEGRSATLFQLPGEVFVTAPVLTTSGEIFVATERELVCIGPEFDASHRTIIR